MVTINILHLLWIVPISASIGLVISAFFFAAHMEETEDDYFDD